MSKPIDKLRAAACHLARIVKGFLMLFKKTKACKQK